MFDQMAGYNDELFNDQWVRTLYDISLFDFGNVTKEDRALAINALRDYMEQEYGMDFDDVFDWEAYREAYDSGAT
jgi:hypothetical protein